MSRPARTLHAYQLIEPDEQLDLFACRESRMHLVARQLELAAGADRTLCGSLLPAHPRYHPVLSDNLRDPRICPLCLAALARLRKGLLPVAWTTF